MPQSRFLTVDGVRLHYLDWGKDGAQPLLLLHAHPLNAHAWDDVAEAFTAS
jgi:pimeloyl-ACP methyl ester carboxylesterase